MIPEGWFSTYRIQLHREFPLTAAAAVLPYLRDLGISHVYLSPCFQATPGSSHGYDVTDPGKISDDLGGEEGWTALQEAAKAAGLGVLLDIVPNHMATHASNPWWNDLMEQGPLSEHSETFDVFPVDETGDWKVILCVLDQPYGKVMEEGGFEFDLSTGLPRIRYLADSWPLNPTSWQAILEPLAPELEPVFSELREAETSAKYAELVNGLVAGLEAILASPERRQELEKICEEIAGNRTRLHALIDEQFYRLAWWKLDAELTNYRRFFNIGSLVGVRVECEDVFDRSHARITTMVERGEVAGLRVDHPDGLRDPKTYFERLRERIPNGPIFVEKILDGDESLPDWQVEGTVGYEFLGKVNRLWMDEDNADILSATYAEFTGHSINYQALVREKKAYVLKTHFAPDLERLCAVVIQIAQQHWSSQDVSHAQIQRAIALLTTSLSVYRTYLVPDDEASAADVAVIAEAFALTRSQVLDGRGVDGGVDPAVIDFLEDIFTREVEGPLENEFIARWQQLTPAVMAKGVEDTTFYCFDRLVSCNEVGSQPSALGIAPSKFHEFCSRLHNDWPATLLPTSTHDNKRSEDVRARINVLSEIPDQWAGALQGWSSLNLPAWKGRTPDRHAEYLLYQTLIGAWPLSTERAWEYLLKASREAKIHTSWNEPQEIYEAGLMEFCELILVDPEFIARLEKFVQLVIRPGRINSLAQTLIQLTAPGIPDIYQGTELWDLSLVDPDNRRPVDYELRRQLLDAAEGVPDDWESGVPKLWLTRRVLQLRREREEDFQSGYQPVSASGVCLGHLFAYLRGEGVMVVVPRFTLTLDGDWGDTMLPLPRGEWRNIFDDCVHEDAVTPGVLFAQFPVAVLVACHQ